MRVATHLFLVLFTLGAAYGAGAQDHAHKNKGPNGGQLREVGVYHFELVLKVEGKELKDTEFFVYVTDAKEQKLSTHGASGRVTVTWGKNKVAADLSPAGDNRLRGMAKLADDHDMRFLVTITLPGKKAEQVRFSPFADKDHGHKH